MPRDLTSAVDDVREGVTGLLHSSPAFALADALGSLGRTVEDTSRSVSSRLRRLTDRPVRRGDIQLPSMTRSRGRKR